MRSDDYKQLQLERIRLSVAYDETKLKVAGWLGKQSYQRDDEIEGIPLMTSVRGLGSAPPIGEADLLADPTSGPAPSMDVAFARLAKAKTAAASRMQRETALEAAKQRKEELERGKRTGSGSEDELQRGDPSQREKKRAVSAFDAYKKSKKRK